MSLLSHLTLPSLCISERCIKMKINLNLYFHTSLWCFTRLYEDLKGLHKPIEAPRRSVKKKLSKFSSSSGIGTRRVKQTSSSWKQAPMSFLFLLGGSSFIYAIKWWIDSSWTVRSILSYQYFLISPSQLFVWYL